MYIIFIKAASNGLNCTSPIITVPHKRYAGTSVFRSIQDRLSAAMALKEAGDTRAVADKMDAKTGEARQALAAETEKLEQTSISPPRARTLTSTEGGYARSDRRLGRGRAAVERG